MKYIYRICIISTIVFFGACADELELSPAQALSTDEALADLDGMQTALFGAYDGMQRVGYYGRNFLVIPEIEANLVYLTIANSNRFVSEYTYQWTPSNGNITGIWNLGYNTILRANNVINNIDEIEGEAGRKSQIKGEALAIRALVHFDLVRFFAKQYTNGSPSSDLGVPIVLLSEIAEPTRNTVEEVYNQIIIDLNEARSLLGNESIFRFSPDAVDALLARVHLYKGDYAAAEAAASSIISSGRYALSSDVVSMFSAPGSSEEIFTLSFEAAENNGSDNLGGIYNPDTYGDIRVATDLLDLYEDGDTRLAFIYLNTNNEFYTSKFLSQDGVAGLHSPKILRLAEMYLIRAEARLQSGNATGALADLNTLRATRNASALTSVNLATVIAERQRELAFEGHTLFDYWRNGLTMNRQQCTTGLEVSSPCSVDASSTLAVHPIPQREMDVNQNMVQNPGYQ